MKEKSFRCVGGPLDGQYHTWRDVAAFRHPNFYVQYNCSQSQITLRMPAADKTVDRAIDRAILVWCGN